MAKLSKMCRSILIDILVKLARATNLVLDLEETFATVWKYNIKLYSTKCIFWVRKGKFLGYLVIEKGIEDRGHVEHIVSSEHARGLALGGLISLHIPVDR